MSVRELLLTVSIVLIMSTSCAPIGGNTRTLAEPIPLLPTHYAATTTSTISAATSNATIAPAMQQRYQSDLNAQCPKISEKTPLNVDFIAGSLVEPTCVAYNAAIERGGGIRPGDRAVILGAGPVGIAACAILKRAGASQVIISETQDVRAQMALKMGADARINPLKEDFADRVLEITDGMGADLFMEATGLPDVVYPGIERVIWEGRTLLSTVVVTARAEAKMPVAGEVLQVRKARIVGAQGHSGHGNFPRVIDCMASGMDMTPMSTKKIHLEELPENIIKLQTDRSECKVTYIAN